MSNDMTKPSFYVPVKEEPTFDFSVPRVFRQWRQYKSDLEKDLQKMYNLFCFANFLIAAKN